MNDSIAKSGAVIESESGGAFLQFMAEAYHGLSPAQKDCYPEQFNEAVSIGLLELSGEAASLTPSGFLVANVAKEYQIYLRNGRIPPPPFPPEEMYRGKDVIDLGCSFGRWLWHFEAAAKSARGLEMQPDYIRLGIALSKREGRKPPQIAAGSIEDIDKHLPDASTDFLFCRLVFNYVNILNTLSKANDSLRHGGILWLQIDSIGLPLARLVRFTGRPRDNGFALFSVLNSLLCMATGSQASVRMRGRMHASHRAAYPCVWWWRRALGRTGYSDIRVIEKSRRGFVLCGRKG